MDDPTDTSANKWCLIESDPGVFTALCRDLKVEGVEFEEVYSLEEDSLSAFQKDDVAAWAFNPSAWASSSSTGSPQPVSDTIPVYGLIFLFKFQRESEPRQIDTSPHPSLFFARQIVPNACATQAILSVLFNRPEITVGVALECEKAYILSEPSSSEALSPEKLAERRGTLLGQCETIRSVHNSFKASSVLEVPETGRSDGEAFHYVTYVPFEGNIYELDGLQKGPVCHGECTGRDWVTSIAPEIVQRMEKIQSGDSFDGEIRFNLLALVPSKLERVKRALLTRRHVRHLASIKALSLGAEVSIDDEMSEEDDSPEDVPSIEDLPDDIDRLHQLIDECSVAIPSLEVMLEVQKAKHESWDEENSRRRHDWVPFLLNMLKLLAQRGELSKAHANALERVALSEAKKVKSSSTESGVKKEKEKEKESDDKDEVMGDAAGQQENAQ